MNSSLNPMPDELAAYLNQLTTQIIGHPLRYERQVASTNDLVRDAACSGATEGLVILADEQTAGRGRMRRSWLAPPGSSLLMSFLLRPSWLAVQNLFALTMLASVALCETIEQVVDIPAQLKWPNDLLLAAPASGIPGQPALRKAAGILSELVLADGHIQAVTIGIGLNIAFQPSELVDGRDLRLSATSVNSAAGREVARGLLLRVMLERLDERYLRLRAGAHDELFTAWRGRLAMLGQPVRIRRIEDQIEGWAEDVDRSGALRLRDAQGTLHTITAGDVEA